MQLSIWCHGDTGGFLENSLPCIEKNLGNVIIDYSNSICATTSYNVLLSCDNIAIIIIFYVHVCACLIEIIPAHNF